MKHDHWDRPLRARLHMLARYVYDAGRYLRHSSAVGHPKTVWQRRSHMTKLAHVIEKGLALPDTRLNFGEQNIRELCALLRKDAADRSMAHVMAVNALRAYADFHERAGVKVLPVCTETLAAFSATPPDERGSVIDVSRTNLANQTMNAAAFMRSRHSVRQFSEEPVDMAALAEAVALAQTSPSVCNRQSGRVHFILDKDLIARALAFQGGNRGFGHGISALAVVTSDLGSFLEPNERNQAFVDGGMFAMSFLLGLHAQHLGACPLNWSRNPVTDMNFRKAVPIPESESVIMMVAIGKLRDHFRVAGSARLPLREVMSIVGATPTLPVDPAIAGSTHL